MKTVHKIIFSIAMCLAIAAGAHAFPTDTYAPASVLAEGKWVKISVEQTGLHLISVADLRAWGFTDPSKVRVYGYGGRRIPDHFTLNNYKDDLPQVQTQLTKRGIVFYGVGALTREEAGNDGTHFHTQNPYSSLGYYYLSDRETEARAIPEEGRAPEADRITTFTDGVRHERDLVSAIKSGHRMVGEDFRFTPAQTFTFQMPGRVEGTQVWMQCDFYANVNSQPMRLSFAANGAELPSVATDRVRNCASDEDGDSCRIRKQFAADGETLRLSVSASTSGLVKTSNLDNISVCYTRRLAMPAGHTLLFSVPVGSPELAGATQSTVVWDVTDPLDITRMKTADTAGGVAWTNEVYGRRSYAAWDENGTFLTPKIADRGLRNQNIHAMQTPEMVIITNPELRSQAERLASMHSTGADSISVAVLTPETIYNEFSSGSADYNAFRRMLKMFYDRSKANPDGPQLKYVMLMGAVSYDHRGITEEWRNLRATTLPVWQTDEARGESYSYSSDDPITFLEDNSGLLNGRDVMSVAVGRIPARSLAQARTFADRIISYHNNPPEGDWRNRVLLLADDGDGGIHLTQTEDEEKQMRSTDGGSLMTYHKVYLDAYQLQGGVTKVAREKLHNMLTDGVALWSYVGHGSTTALTAEGVFTLQDITGFYQKRPAFFYGATCSFLWWDSPTESALQNLTLNTQNGLVGGISAVRPVQIARNGPFTAVFGREVFDRDSNGRPRGMGEVLRRTKNSFLNETNKMRYVMIGDPALPLAIPANTVKLDSINGIPVEGFDSETEPPCLPALSKVRMTGSIEDAGGNPVRGFDGWLSLSLYDAETSFATIRGDYDNPFVADEQGERLFSGRTEVKDGRWTIEFYLPSEIADNYRPATMSAYAVTSDASAEAMGVDRRFYVYGQADNELADNEPPVIEFMYLNHESFEPGETINDTPMLLARVSDNIGLNMAANGLGHQMSLRIDDNISLSDLSGSFTPAADGSASGDIAYQIPALAAGAHTATLKVWDIVGNSTSASVDFFVDPNKAPTIFDVYSDANPATVEANFFIRHNRPDAMLTVTIDIYTIGGRRVWSRSVKGRADMFETSPVNWNLTDDKGGRVGRGIYVYRATVTTEGTADTPGVSSSATRRIAVAPL